LGTIEVPNDVALIIMKGADVVVGLGSGAAVAWTAGGGSIVGTGVGEAVVGTGTGVAVDETSIWDDAAGVFIDEFAVPTEEKASNVVCELNAVDGLAVHRELNP
jgi:hypothetical protein